MVSFNGMAGNFNTTWSTEPTTTMLSLSNKSSDHIPFQFSEDVVQEFQVSSTGYEADLDKLVEGW